MLKLRRKFTRGRGREGRKEGRKEGLCLRRAPFPVLDGVGKFLRRRPLLLSLVPSLARASFAPCVCAQPLFRRRPNRRRDGRAGKRSLNFPFLPLKDRAGRRAATLSRAGEGRRRQTGRYTIELGGGLSGSWPPFYLSRSLRKLSVGSGREEACRRYRR